MRIRGMIFAVLLAACSGDPDEGGTCDQDTQGFVPCGTFNTCQPGQYCVDPTFGTCETGCLADVNCGCNQRCAITPEGASGCELPSPILPPGAPDAHPSPSTPDAGGPVAVCGDAVCSAGETAEGCSRDCGNLDQCEGTCSSYGFFGCLAPGELEACQASCVAATETQRMSFLFCTSNTGPVDETECATHACFAYLP